MSYKEEHPVDSVEAVEGQRKDRFANVDKRKVMMKIDLRVIPAACILYLLAFLDRYVSMPISLDFTSSCLDEVLSRDVHRVNIGNAAVFGLSTDLKLKGNEFNVALAIL
jgi:hypothetical protein